MSITYIMVAVWIALLIAWGAVTLWDRRKPNPTFEAGGPVDYYTATAADQFKVGFEEVTPWMRECVKRRAYREHYGMGQARVMDLDETELHMELDELISEVEKG
jgi:hypothetical protein